MRIHVNASVLYPLFGRVVRELERSYGVSECSVLFYGHDGDLDLADVGGTTGRVTYLTDWLAKCGTNVAADMTYLKRCEERYGFPHVYLAIVGDRFLSKMPHERALRIMEIGFRMVEEIYDTCRPDAVFSDPVACFISHIQYRVAKARGIPFYAMTGGRLDNRFVVIGNDRELWETPTATYEELKRNGLPDEWRAEAREFLETFRQKQVQPEFAVALFRPPLFEAAQLKVLTNLARRRRMDPNNFILFSLWQALKSRSLRVLKRRVIDPGYFEAPVNGEKFVFFPLHFQPELTTLSLAPFHLEQTSVIENIAKALPLDHRLYVKEHPSSIGRRPRGFYARIRRIPNVRLIAPEVKSHKLIRESSVVCTIAGTAGWEAILYRRPVITLGVVNYNDYDQVQHVRSWQELPEAMHRAINQFVVDDNLLETWVAANLHGAFEGDISYAPGMDLPCLRPENIAKLARGVAQTLGVIPMPHPLTSSRYTFEAGNA